MYQVNSDQFHELVNEAMSLLPKEHIKNLQNVALIVEDVPSPEQRTRLGLQPNQTLFGLYEGVPLSQRQGQQKVLPDKITLYKLPIEYHVNDLSGLKEQIKHVLWHEIAHYYGLGHEAIASLEN